jgi:hypothetical protein
MMPVRAGIAGEGVFRSKWITRAVDVAPGAALGRPWRQGRTSGQRRVLPSMGRRAGVGEPSGDIEWSCPRGGYGVLFKFG